jgi:hypothetical protein
MPNLPALRDQKEMVARSYNPDMSLRFRRTVKLLPGVRLNLGLHGAGLSVGPRGLHVGVNRRGMYTRAGIRGSGLYAMRHIRSSPADPTVTGAAGGVWWAS